MTPKIRLNFVNFIFQQQVGSINSLSKVFCQCNNTAAVGSDFQLLLHTIDFPPTDVIKQITLKFTAATDSPIIVALISTLFGLYFVGIVFAWRKDDIDTKRAIPFSLLDNNDEDAYEYLITVYTGSCKDAGTSASVGCILVGKYGISDPRALYDPRFPTFQKSDMNSFILKTYYELGDLQSIQIWHNNSGEKPSWFLSQVIVEDLTNNAKYVFLCEEWLAVESTDGRIERELFPANPSQLQNFWYLFYKHCHLSDSHLWISVFIRPSWSSFTRVQRISCCWFFVSSVMLLNAIFLGINEISFPPITTSNVVTGLVSYAIIIPFKLGIVSMFRFAVSKPKRNSKYQSRGNTNEVFYNDSMYFKDALKLAQSTKMWDDNLVNNTNQPPEYATNDARSEQISFCTNDVMEEFPNLTQFQTQDVYTCVAEQYNVDFSIYDEKVNLPRHKQCRLPHWCVYIAWTAVVTISLTSASLVSFFGFKFEKEKILQWITSVFVSAFVEILVIQPLGVLIRALYIALVLKEAPELSCSQRNPRDRTSDADNNKFLNGNDGYEKEHAFWFPRPLQEEVVVNAREHKLLEIKSIRMLKEIVVYVLFLMSLFVVSFGHRDPLAFSVANSMEEAFLQGSYSGKSLVQVKTTNLKKAYFR